jgi:hypothetical protein
MQTPIFTDNSVCSQKFLPTTQSSLKKQNGEYKPNTLHKWNFWFSSQVTYPDGIAQYK